MPALNVKVIGLSSFVRALKRNPKKTIKAINTFLVKSITAYRRSIMRNPWRVGGSGGGAPVDTTNLVSSHQDPSATKIKRFEAWIGPAERVTYAKYVHGRREGEINKRTGVRSRPWLTWAFNKKYKEVLKLEDQLLNTIVIDLAK